MAAKHLIKGRGEVIWRYYRRGFTERYIAERLGVSKTTVHYWIAKKQHELRRVTGK